jgi:hypothetical protein
MRVDYALEQEFSALTDRVCRNALNKDEQSNFTASLTDWLAKSMIRNALNAFKAFY